MKTIVPNKTILHEYTNIFSIIKKRKNCMNYTIAITILFIRIFVTNVEFCLYGVLLRCTVYIHT